jgi:hypothetical protein
LLAVLKEAPLAKLRGASLVADRALFYDLARMQQAGLAACLIIRAPQGSGQREGLATRSARHVSRAIVLRRLRGREVA